MYLLGFKAKLLVGLALIVAIPAAALFAESASGTATVSFQLAPSQSLSISSGSSNGRSAVSAVRIPRPSATELQRGYVEQLSAVRLNIQSNIPWKVMVRTDDVSMGRSFDGQFVKPVSDLKVRAQGRTYLTLSNRDQTLAAGHHGSHNIAVDYKTLFDSKTHHDGNYLIKVVYTITGR